MTATGMVYQVSQQEQALVQEKELVKVKEWLKLFPEQVTENYTSSLTFIKQLTAIAVSTITYLKNAFPEDSYNNESFGGLKLKVLRRTCCDELAQFVSTSVQQAFDAFDKKYVQQLALCFYDGECRPENLIEYHVFSYSYKASGAALSISSQHRDGARRAFKCSARSVREKTTMLLRSLSLFVWQHCKRELPLNYDISLRLYYNDDAPEGYQAPGFQSTEDVDHLKATLPESMCLGWVETPYHKIIARTFVRDLVDADSDTAVPSDNQPEITQADNDTLRSTSVTSGSSLEAGLRCPCGKPDARGQALVTCRYCHMQQHQACFGLRAPVQEHCCESCADQDSSRRPSDPLLAGLEGRKRECLCIFRRTLDFCSRLSTLSGRELTERFRLSATSASKMIRLLQSHYILPSASDDDLAAPRKINHLRLKLTLKRFFQMDDQDSLVDRLVAETARATIDPVAEVLTPEEKASLMTSNLGTVIESPERPPVNTDPTLQEYRQAVAAEEDITEELPLSGSHNPVKDVARIGKKPLKRKGDDEDWLPNKLSKLRSGARTKRRA